MISLRQITLRRGGKVVLQDASATLQPGEKVALVGHNGAGKSSLFALLGGRLSADAGDVVLPPSWRLAEVAQDMPQTDMGATAFVLEGDTRLQAAQRALAAAEAAGDGHAMAEAHVQLSEAGAFDARARAQAMLLGLGFKLHELDAPVNSFSGGWRMRLQLARALICPADVMLLDEPTNHLDLDALVWLEDWLKKFPGTLLIISHDREFLDAVTRVTLHLDGGSLMRYGGNYTAFESLRAERLAQQQAQYERQQERTAQLQRFIARFKAKASKAKQAQSRVKALALMERVGPVLAAADFAFDFREPLGLPNPMLSLRAVDCGYAAGAAVVQAVTRSVLPGQRVGILGANGQGKSTLVKTLAGTLPALGGQLTQGKGLTIGYFAQQEMDVLRPDDGALAHMIRLARDTATPAREQELRDFLGTFRFTGEMVHQPVGTLSGGEKARLVLAMLVWQRPNLLLLDEPTNHLDLTTREALSMALNTFEGSVLLVSHDRALLREVCDEFWLVCDGQMQAFDGDLDDYQIWLAERSRAALAALRDAAGPSGASARDGGRGAAAEPAPGGRSREDRRQQAQARQRLAEQAKPIKSRLTQIEADLVDATGRRDALQLSLVDAGMPAAQRAQQGHALKALLLRIDALEQEWLELGEQLQALQGAAA